MREHKKSDWYFGGKCVLDLTVRIDIFKTVLQTATVTASHLYQWITREHLSTQKAYVQGQSPRTLWWIYQWETTMRNYEYEMEAEHAV